MDDATPKWLEELLPATEQLKKLGFTVHGWDYGTISVRPPTYGTLAGQSILTVSLDDVAIIVEHINKLAGKTIL